MHAQEGSNEASRFLRSLTDIDMTNLYFFELNASSLQADLLQLLQDGQLNEQEY